MNTSRRTILRSAVGVGAGVGAKAFASAPATAVTRHKALLSRSLPTGKNAFTGKLSPNGWPINRAANAGGGVWGRPVAGAGFDVNILIGDVESILVHVVRRFHYEIDTLTTGDVIGFEPGGGLHLYELNHASGTAIDIHPSFYPVGSAGGFYPYQLAIIRDILAECEGVVKWGGDFTVPDESHFQIDLPPANENVATVATKLRTWTSTAGVGAGVIMNPTDKDRHAAARRLELRQKG